MLGSGDFVETLLQESDERIKRQLPLNERTEPARQRIGTVCRAEGIGETELTCGSRRRKVSAVRRRLAQQLTEELGLSLAETARQLGVSTSAVWRIVKGGRD